MRAVVLLTMACGACGARKLGPPLEPGRPIGSTMPTTRASIVPAANLVATLSDKAVGPHLVLGDKGGMVAYLATEGSARQLVVLPVDASGAPTRDARAVADVPIDSGTLVLERTGSSYVSAWTALTERGEAVFALGIGADGSASAPLEIARTTDDVVWIAIVPTAKGSVLLWAEETQRSGANILGLALDERGRPRGVPSYIARGVSGWQALPSSSGAALATLGPELAWTLIDADAHALGAPIKLGPAGKDMDVVRAKDGYVFAWTDRATEPSVRVLRVDESGKAQGTRDVTLGRGAGSLVALTSGDAGVMIAWEEARKGARRVHADVLDGSALRAGATLTLQTGSQPEIAASKGGFVALAFTQICDKSAAPSACLSSPLVASAIALDARGAVVSADVLQTPQQPAFAWDLRCGARCVALAATVESKTRVFAVPLFARPSDLKVAAIPAPAPDAPEVMSIETLASGAAVIDVAATELPQDHAWITASLAANDDGQTATLTARPLGGDAIVISKRALPVGGVAIAPSDGDDSAAIAWVTRDGGDAYVRVTKIDRKGKKLAEAQLATGKGDASDAAIAAIDGGLLVAWVDTRDGNGEVYAARLGKDLRAQREERITNAPGDATDLTMLASGDRAWLAWADARESPKDGFADVWMTALGADAKPKITELRVLPTAAHSRSPSLAPSGSGAAVAWIEDAPAGADPKTSQSYGAFVAFVDEGGRRALDPARVPLDEGFATGVWLDPRVTDRARGVLARAGRDLQLHAFEVGMKASVTWPLLVLEGPPTLDVPLAFAGDALLFGDDGATAADRRLRKTSLRWKR